MCRQVIEYLDLLVNIRKLKQILSKGGYLYDTGWKKSRWSNCVTDREGNNIPWLTYPFLSFIEPRLNADLDLLEFGSGYSTAWWGERCKTVRSLEDSREWFETVSKQLEASTNVEIVFCEDMDNATLPEGSRYNIIIVDDIGNRVLHIRQSAELLSEDGIIILDDSEREEYNEGRAFLLDKGFKSIDFWGLAPSVAYTKCTTVFYRDNNCIGL